MSRAGILIAALLIRRLAILSLCLLDRDGRGYVRIDGQQRDAHPTSNTAGVKDLVPGAGARFSEQPHCLFCVDLIANSRADTWCGSNIPTMSNDRGKCRC